MDVYIQQKDKRKLYSIIEKLIIQSALYYPCLRRENRDLREMFDQKEKKV